MVNGHEIDVEKNQVVYWVKNIQHHETHNLYYFFINFYSRKDIQSFNCDYKIISNEIPNYLQGKLHFILSQ